MSTPPFPEMDELLQRLLDGQVLPEEAQRLWKAVQEDPKVRDYYIDSMLACAVVRRSSIVTGELSESDLIRAISDLRDVGGRRYGWRVYAVVAAVILACLVLAVASLIRPSVPKGPAVGRLAGVYEARWAGSHPGPDGAFCVGSYDLREGLATIELDRGTCLFLEAPCRIDLKGLNEVVLRHGRLVAMVPPEARGFRVRTATALITDLGTEFGVLTHQDGSTEAHVLKGRVQVALEAKGSARQVSLVVSEGSAAIVDAAGRTVRGGLAARPDHFVLALPQGPIDKTGNLGKKLNLADIVGGGNGLGTGALDRGIDLGTGQVFKGPATKIRWARQNVFWRTPYLAGVDCVFIPSRAPGPVVISSTGLTFPGCPRTLGSYFGGPTNSGKFFDLPSGRSHIVRLNGITFGTSVHPALTLHPNAGITFDLDQIRYAHPDMKLDRFTAVCGIPKDLPQTPFSSADVWILLDGEVCCHLHFPRERHVLEDVDVPIPSRARFLTLVATCPRRADYSWILFGDPYLRAASDQVEAGH